MDNLEKYIHENKDAFNNSVPSAAIWKHIEQDLPPTKTTKIVLMNRWMQAAAAVAVLLIGFFIGKNSASNSTESPWTSEVAEIEHHYNRELKDKMAVLATYKHQDIMLEQDLKRFDEQLDALKYELQIAPKAGQAAVVHALIQNYKARVELLERVLQRLNDLKNKEKYNNNESDKII